MLTLLPAALVLLAQVAAQAPTPSAENTPPANNSASEPYWPAYPDGKSAADYMLSNTSGEDDLTGRSNIAQFIVAASNQWRAQFSAQPVTWNETAARVAQRHVETCRWEHWGSDNLAKSFGSDASMRFDVSTMVAMWAYEWPDYPWGHPEQQRYDHFTAMTWNASNTLGCAWNVACANETEWPSLTYFVCNYWPQGNVMTDPPGQEFEKNIHNFTGWPVNEVASSTSPSSSAASTGRATPTSGLGSAASPSANPAPGSGASALGIPLAAAVVAGLVAVNTVL